MDEQNFDFFSGVCGIDENTFPLEADASEQDLLDYMVLVLSRFMTCDAAFKGGHSRRTHDVDLSVAYIGDYNGVKTILQKIAEYFKAKDYISSYVIKDTISEGNSGGMTLYAKDGRKLLGVDIGLHNISYGIRHYNLGFSTVKGFTIERMLADKLIAITTRKRFRRAKDLYDFYAVTNVFDVNIPELAACIERRGGAQWENIPFDLTVIQQYQHAWDTLDLTAFSGEPLEKPDFDTALDRFYRFALPLKTGTTLERWECQNGRCI